jgi:tripeptidyl-peptidase-2
MSFGEDPAYGCEDKGQFIKMLRDEVIRKKDVLFVTSAGNAG